MMGKPPPLRFTRNQMNTPESHVTNEGLVRVIGTRALSLGIVNMIVGAGIFVLPGLIAALLGPAAIIAYLICSVAVALVFLCIAEAGSRVTRTGGVYAYIEDAFGPFAGFIASILLWFGWGILSNAAVGIALAELLALAFPFFADPVPKSVFLIALFGGLGWINIRGVQSGVRFATFNTYAKLIPLAILIVVGAFSVQWDHIAIRELPPLADIGAGTLMLVFAFGGGELALNATGEVKNPSKTVPLALFYGISIVLVLYMAIQGVAQGVLEAELAQNLEAPLVATAERAMGSWGRTFMLIGAGLSIFGVTSGHILNHPRAVFAAARDGLLPSKLAEVHPRFKTPHISIVFCVTLACAIALTGAFKTLAIVSSGSLLLLYLGCCLSVLKLRKINPVSKETPNTKGIFVLPGGPTIPIASTIVILWLLSNMTRAESLGLGALIAVSIAAYFLVRRTRA